VDSNEKMSRGRLLQSLAIAPIAIGAFAAIKAQEADAAKTAQSAVLYVNHPNGAKKCSGCKFYIAAKSGKGNGACQIVAGAISPNGYCVAYAPK
jgi:hypothetical protein